MGMTRLVFSVDADSCFNATEASFWYSSDKGAANGSFCHGPDV